MKPGIKPFHVLDRINRDTPFADLSEYSVGAGANTIQSWTVKGRTQALAALIPRQVMKSFVGVFDKAEASKQASRLFNGMLFFAVSIVIQMINRGFQILLRVSGSQERKIARKSFFGQEPSNLPRLIEIRKRQARQPQPRRRERCSNLRFSIAPKSEQLLAVLAVLAGFFDLFRYVPSIIFDR